MNKTGINWCDFTWNPMTGCLHGCDYCYARKLAEGRLKKAGVYPQGFAPTFHEKRLSDPVNKAGAVIFVGSMTDMMGEWQDESDINAVIEVCYQEKQHTFLWLTKNPGRYAHFTWPDNCWLGMTLTGNGEECGLGFRAFMRTPGIKRFLSIEPCVGLVGLGGAEDHSTESSLGDVRPWLDDIHQVILGPETGPGARPMKEEWAEAVREQCDAFNVPFWRKDKAEGKLVWRTDAPA